MGKGSRKRNDFFTDAGISRYPAAKQPRRQAPPPAHLEDDAVGNRRASRGELSSKAKARLSVSVPEYALIGSSSKQSASDDSKHVKESRSVYDGIRHII